MEKLPKCEDFTPYDTIILTGGEPLLHTARLVRAIGEIRKKNPAAKIYIYTAAVKHKGFHLILDLSDGMTLTLHDKEDLTDFYDLDLLLNAFKLRKKKSLRLNVFSEVGRVKASDLWVVKDNIEWIEDCPLPSNEVFMRY